MKRSAKKLLVLTVAFAMVFSAFSAYGFAVEGTAPQVTKADVKATSIKLTTQLVMQKEKRGKNKATISVAGRDLPEQCIQIERSANCTWDFVKSDVDF